VRSEGGGDSADGGAHKTLLILFASETGTAEGYAYTAAKMLRPCKLSVVSNTSKVYRILPCIYVGI
jgi:sulfite reductase alpha subunit-like flavoprotein